MAGGTASDGASDGGFDPVAFLADAVRIPSHEDVDEMRSFLVETLADRGVSARVGDAGTVVAMRTGSESPVADPDDGTHLLLNTHIDTVTPHVPYERSDGTDDGPGAASGDGGFGSGASDDGPGPGAGAGEVIRGRGSCDAKGPLAVLLSAFFAVEPAEGSAVTLAVTPDEEALSTGAHAFVSAPDSPIRDADGVIVGEPTGLDVCTAAKGRFEGTITLSGANAHAAEPDSGINAVAALEEVLGALRTFDAESDQPAAHPELGAATLTPTVVEGGGATNQVPDDCRLTFDRRSVPPETAAGFREALGDRLRAAVADDVGVDVALTDRPTPFLEPWATDADEPLVETLAAAAGGDIRPFTAATEASYFAAHAPTVVFGPGVLADDEGAVAHAPREYVRLADVRAAADALESTLERLVG